MKGTLVDTSGRPVSNGHVYAYRQGKDAAGTLGPADAMSEPSGADGGYLLIIPEGTYTLAARKRVSGAISGPLRNGDLHGQVPEPVRAHGEPWKGVRIVMREFRQGAEGDPKRILTTDTRIEGRVIDPVGRPVSGAHVFAYFGVTSTDPPDYFAPVTGEDGVFSISLPQGGPYTIGARTGLRGRPRSDDQIGFWGNRDQPRIISKGVVTTGVEIVVEPYGEKP